MLREQPGELPIFVRALVVWYAPRLGDDLHEPVRDGPSRKSLSDDRKHLDGALPGEGYCVQGRLRCDAFVPSGHLQLWQYADHRACSLP